MGRAPLGFCLMLRTPPGTPATHVRPRPGHEHGPGTTPSISIDPPINAFTQYVRPRVASPSGLPLARHPRMEQERLRLSPELRTPQSLAAHVGAGTDHRARIRNQRYGISRTSNLAGLLDACDLASRSWFQHSARIGGDFPIPSTACSEDGRPQRARDRPQPAAGRSPPLSAQPAAADRAADS